MSFLVLRLLSCSFLFGHLGREEWKMVAEGLGLTPAQIHSLDHRVANPMAVVLISVGKRSSVRVETLYDLMTDLELPEVADLL